MDFIYLIFGEGDGRNDVAHAINKNNLKDKVFLLGRIENACKYIKAGDIFVLPSRTEAFPYVLLESGLAGASVLASNVGGIPELITENETGVLFDLNNKDDALIKLNKLINNKSLRDELALNIHERVVSDFSIEKMIKETVEIYK